jgi:thioredoxin-like negative regulator of GroEL
MLAPSAGRRFYATAENGASSDSAPVTAPQPTVSPIISIQTPEEYQKLVLDASKTRPIIVDCYAEYVLHLRRWLLEMKIAYILFHRSWCKPCKDLTPVIEAVIKSREGKVSSPTFIFVASLLSRLLR